MLEVMQHALPVLLTFYCVILCANILISFSLWHSTREELYRTTIWLWSACLFNFVLQSLFREPGVGMLAADATYLGVVLLLMLLAGQIYRLNFAWKRWGLVSLLGPVFGVLSWLGGSGFHVAAGMVAVSLALPQFNAARRVAIVRGKRAASCVFFAFLILNGLVTLAYPLLRLDPEGALWGYSATFFLLVMSSIFVPAFILKQLSLRYQKGLEEQVRVRTQELRMLSEQNSALLNIVCHDLSTPITVLQVAGGFFAREDVRTASPVEIEKNQSRIMKSLKTIREILQQVRNLQKIRVGKEDLLLEPHDPAEVVEEVCALFEEQMATKELSLVFENRLVPGTKFRFDRGLMKNQVIMNLLSNAIKFSRRASVVKVILSDEADTGFIEVVDQGIGIPEEILPHLFDFSAKTSRPGTSNEKGTGFGLPLVKTSLEMMGARIEVFTSTAEGDEGTRFRLRLPRAG